MYPIRSHGCISWWHRNFVWKIGIGTSPHKFHVFFHQNNPLKIVILWPVRVIITNWLAEGNNLRRNRRDGTNAVTKLQHHSLKDRMGRWYGRGGTFLYVGIRGVSKTKTFNPIDAQIKTKSQNLLDKICIKDPFNIAPMKRQRYVAPQLVPLKVWISNGHFLALLCIAVSCN